MLKRYVYLLFALFSSSTYGQFGPGTCDVETTYPIQDFNICNYDPWILVFEDNFEGNDLDQRIWDPLTGVPRDPNFDERKAWHKPENIVLENGLLKIISKEEALINQCFDWWDGNTTQTDCSDFSYSTGEMWSKRKFEYGMFQAKVKIPRGKGFWPAFWLYGDNNVWNEIDIFEFWNEENLWGNYDSDKLARVHHMNMWYDYDSDGSGNQCSVSENYDIDFSESFHVFTVVWEKQRTRWYVDGDLKHTSYRYATALGQITGCDIKGWTPYLLNKIYAQEPMSIIFNTAIQSGSNAPNTATPFPSKMEVDWVRYYQRHPCDDVEITEPTQYVLDDEVFNAVAGENILVNTDYTISPDQQLDMIASNSITLKPGFHSQNGSSFVAKIDEYTCEKSSYASQINHPKQSIPQSLLSESQSSKSLETENIQISPNPNSGVFYVDFNDEEPRKYLIKVMDLNGRLVQFGKIWDSARLMINLKISPGEFISYKP
ncbi:MAG: family 16 glycosylhydrolase [Flavobacteriales bacterium]|nr:family 16 glycosylhydrolase [Flavobacteriales bacterium]